MATMYAQLIEARVDRRQPPMLEQIVRSELLPALRAEPGFSGAVSLTNRERGKVLLVLLWETEEQAARPLATDAAPFANAPSTLSKLFESGSCLVTVWEVDARS